MSFGAEEKQAAMSDVKTMEWREFINLFKIEDLMGRRSNAELKSDMLSKILFFNKDDTVQDAIEELTVTKVVSAPVYDDAENKFIGFIDMLDLACYCADQFGPDLFQKDKSEQAQEIERNLMQQPVSALMDKSGRDKWLTLDRKDPLSRLFATLAHPDIHRVPIVDNEVTGPEKVLAIITEYEVVRWLWESRTYERFPAEILRLPAKNLLSTGTSDLALIPHDKTLLDAFKLMKDRRFSGLGVINEAKELVGNVSASDIKVAAASALELVHLLRMRLDNFLEMKRTLMINLNERVAPPRPITVNEEEPFSSVLEKFVVNHIHRVWVVKQNGQAKGTGAGIEQKAGGNFPIGGISLTDVARVLSLHGLFQ